MNAPNNPNLPNPPNAQNPPNAPKKKGLPCGLIAIGCGCLTLILLAVVAVGGFLMFRTTASAVEDEGGGLFGIFGEEGGIVDMIAAGAKEASKEGDKKSTAQNKSKKNAEKKAKEEMTQALSPEKVRSYLAQPLTPKDINEHQKFMRDWAKDPAQIEYIKQTKNIEKLTKDSKDKEGSVANSLKVVNASAKAMTAMQEVTEAFDKYVRKNGGYEKYYGRLLRIGGVVAAAQTVKDANKKFKDPDSDAVAKQMLKERPEVAKEYRKNFDEAKKAIAKAKQSGAKDSNAGLGALMAMGQGPGTVALARMPEKSFKTWDALSVTHRKALRESLVQKDGFGGWFSLFAVNPSVLLVSASMAELDALREE